MGLIRFQRLGISVTAAALAVGTALALAPPASAATTFYHYGCTRYGWNHSFCADVFGTGRYVYDIGAFGGNSTKWNGYIVATILASKGNTVYRKQSRYKAKANMVHLEVNKSFPKGKYTACTAGYSIQNGKYHQFAKACQNIF
jgi:hypothetical protein